MRFGTKFFQRYLIGTAILLHLVFGYMLYRFTLAILYSAETLPTALIKSSQRIEQDYPILKPLASTLQSAGIHLNTPTYFWQPFNSENWPTVGPDFNQSYPADNLLQTPTIISDAVGLLTALKNARPGQEIVLNDGTYSLSSKLIRISTLRPTANKPIILRAANAGNVTLELDSLEGIYIDQPHWKISGLRFIGKCGDDTQCEHALHVVGNAKYTEITHNEFINFNAAIKVNELNQQYPDNGLIVRNHFFSTHPRNTSWSVTPINIDHANNWIISRNIIRDFVKTGGNKVSYGAFMKGGVVGGRFENNLVICNSTKQQFDGATIGLSLGGGGMNKRRHRADFETQNVTLRNNIIMHCSDVGIYINKGANSQVNNNTLYNTYGIDVRFNESDAIIFNNILSGKIRSRDNGDIIESGNYVVQHSFLNNKEGLDDLFLSPAIGNFTIKNTHIIKQLSGLQPYPVISTSQSSDFCGNELTAADIFVGAFKDSKYCFSP